MKRLINILYSCAAGLEQAYITFETIKQTHKAALTMATRDSPEAKRSIGFAENVQKQTPMGFTNENP